jgi:hypothetical protein
VAKAGTMPTHKRLGPDDRENLQDRREPSIQLDQEPAITVREPDPPLHLAPQDDQLMSQRCIFCLKPLFDLNSAAKTASTKHSSAIMVRRR